MRWRFCPLLAVLIVYPAGSSSSLFFKLWIRRKVKIACFSLRSLTHLVHEFSPRVYWILCNFNALTKFSLLCFLLCFSAWDANQQQRRKQQNMIINTNKKHKIKAYTHVFGGFDGFVLVSVFSRLEIVSYKIVITSWILERKIGMIILHKTVRKHAKPHIRSRIN